MSSLVEHFAAVVSAVEDKLLTQLQAIHPRITGIHYEYGHLVEITQTLQLLSQDADKQYDKFPIIILEEDIQITSGNAELEQARLRIIIAMSTEPTLVSSQRQADNFNRVLTPIYNELLNQIYLDPYFSVQNPNTDMKHQRYDRKFWGKESIYGNTANITSDYLDAIEIQNMTIYLTPSLCED